MEPSSVAKKPHAVCIPYPFQGHITPMLKLAKLLHSKGFHITFVNTEFIHLRLLESRDRDSLKGLPNFRFETIPGGLPPTDVNATQDVVQAFCDSIDKNLLVPFLSLIAKLNEASTFSEDPLVSCIVADTFMSFTLEAAEKLSIPGVALWPMSASVLWCYLHSDLLVEKILIPPEGICTVYIRLLCLVIFFNLPKFIQIKANIFLFSLRTTHIEGERTNGYLDMPIDIIPGIKNIRLKDLPSFFWDGNELLNNNGIRNVQRASKATAIIINTFDAFETEVVDSMKSLLLPIYSIGPLQLFEQQLPNNQLKSFQSNLLKEDRDCLKWLDSKQPKSVVYVNFGSLTILTTQQLTEFAWGLANCKHPFLWVIRPDLVVGEGAVLPPEFTAETLERSMISGWCPQEEVLSHGSIGGFLTHSGWNSTMDTLCCGVPVICWPGFGDQTTNSRYACVHWEIGMEIDKNVNRDDVERILREFVEGEKGKGMKKKAIEWKKSAEDSTKPGGTSYLNFEKIVKEVLVQKNQ
ncbi:hypothetical protein IFM89_019768 [Coptis chinensis]|uniref:Glycosyltransferase n=1 Tax=Coptis chinensis TaxID=261450 RepID=A0A835HZX4_9MAGN|nr:hypothetical protein IFM89_019768 [Coptis chinensis]